MRSFQVPRKDRVSVSSTSRKVSESSDNYNPSKLSACSPAPRLSLGLFFQYRHVQTLVFDVP